MMVLNLTDFKAVREIVKDLHKAEETQGKIERKIDKIDNTSNKNMERIERLERSNAKLSKNMQLMEERERRRSAGNGPKSLQTFDSDRRDAVRSSESQMKSANSSGSNLSYSHQLSK